MKKELELYVHIPFCVNKCAYCDFLSFSAKQEEVSAYVEALAEEIKGKKEQFSDYCVTTIFLGGGTHSILEGVYTASIFRALRESFDIAENAMFFRARNALNLFMSVPLLLVNFGVLTHDHFPIL